MPALRKRKHAKQFFLIVGIIIGKYLIIIQGQITKPEVPRALHSSKSPAHIKSIRKIKIK